ncbi:UPF0149 family protein [Alkalimonas delamerensis]|uniref:UPF0149 family protein n=1 Tax=Alkalimonas delamerensis TaxID=265981 RepID=A0ABT9GRI9_9GAMM|nr:UPF0149 family protein [Alkalimonas delamerensis]MDP4529598.1 UPF0149 family protein [Alkalimonas delamerensis]
MLLGDAKMPTPYLMPYEQWLLRMEESQLMASPAELHGLISGLLSAGVQAEQQQILPVLYDFLNDNQAVPVAVQKQIVELIGLTAEQLQQTDYAFALLLPSDDDSLIERLEAVVEWCQAFLVGFAVLQTDLSLVPEDIRDAVNQLTEITRLDVHSSSDFSEQENEESYYLVLEHIRILALNCFHEVGVKYQQGTAPKKTLH